MEIFDISRGLFTAEVFDGDTVPVLEAVASLNNGDICNLSDITMCLHNGTHIDAPYHFDNEGKTVDEIPLSKFIGPCAVAIASGPITAQWVEENLPWNCTRLLIKCEGNGYLMDNAVSELCRFNLDLIGVDALSVSAKGNEESVHRELMYNEIAILEGLDLSGISAGNYFLICPPIKLDGAEAAPCRALLLKGILI